MAAAMTARAMKSRCLSWRVAIDLTITAVISHDRPGSKDLRECESSRLAPLEKVGRRHGRGWPEFDERIAGGYYQA
jgi:hypothetical protein